MKSPLTPDSISFHSVCSGQQPPAGPERARRVADDHFVDQPRGCELCGRIAPADHPDVLIARRRHKLCVQLGHVALVGLDGIALPHDLGAVRQHPGRLLVLPLRVVGQDPLVGRRTHHQRADRVGERTVAERPVGVDVAVYQPLQAVAVVDDVAVDAGCRVVDGRHVNCLSSSRADHRFGFRCRDAQASCGPVACDVRNRSARARRCRRAGTTPVGRTARR